MVSTLYIVQLSNGHTGAGAYFQQSTDERRGTRWTNFQCMRYLLRISIYCQEGMGAPCAQVMLLLWSDTLTHAVCAEQSRRNNKQQRRQTSWCCQNRAASQPNRAAACSAPRSLDAEALD
ncbi:hypothetical protein CHARACLAT_000864 [Characodon lateralis]|uniref:Uncharacterized protein n=1 Tax=Characodon lateralis TaxID=208331 RepID=A0ABU7CXK4_9TELE|nr:hypothetical protein [Characodon lateralis]